MSTLDRTATKVMLMSIVPIVTLVMGCVIFAMGVIPTAEADTYTEGICRLSYTPAGLCDYNINDEDTRNEVSCDVTLPRMDLTQYSTHAYPCYYKQSEAGERVLFEKPNDDRNWVMVTGGIAMVVIAIVWLAFIIRYLLKKMEKYNNDHFSETS